ncbi:mevalonate kinase, partial [Thermodesulfobacteriota bacterium]
YGGLVLYETGPPRRAEALTPLGPMDLVIAVTSGKRDTGEMVAGAAAFAERDADGFRSLLDSARKLSAAGKEAIEAGDLRALGGLMNENHGLLQALGVSTPGLDALVEATRVAGAAGSKLTGAGGGGAMIALCPGRQDEVGTACVNAGAAEVIRTRIG